MADEPHLPVLYQAIITVLDPSPAGCYIDGTLGAGGHAYGILQASSPTGKLLGLDLDPIAIGIAAERLKNFGERAIIRQRSYTEMAQVTEEIGWDGVDGILLDLGVSSMQLDSPSRGFSFLNDGPLDMRFSPLSKFSAADLVNSWSEADLRDLIFRYGEDRNARRIARLIIENRPFQTTGQLAALLKQKLGSAEKIHPATRTFQAIRIEVNQELKSVEQVLPTAIKLLKPGGHLAVISFHSLEDRIVKEVFRTESTDCLCPPRQPICTCGHKASIRLVNKKPITSSEEEIRNNSRARSAKLRIVEKLWQP
ncbi:MAG TPA: 16S rRNA (cytosine(1402)-N(4))-methyltransferase RsmH [Anaerolineales bacterium]|nr:16S rRNA (cytosine(1402)-N(4))-methyltransferase RsmH [Anaerolineales bacterium]